MTTDLTDTERRVLSAYVRGGMPIGIANTLGVDLDTVTAVITDRAGLDRGRARELLRTHPGPQPPPPPAVPSTVDPLATVDGVLTAGEAHEGRLIRRLAGRARALLDDLEVRLREDLAERAAVEQLHREQAAARARVAELEAELAAARAVLRPTRPAKTTPDDGSDRAIRAWALAAGVDCPTRGRVPTAVRQAHAAAQTAAHRPTAAPDTPDKPIRAARTPSAVFRAAEPERGGA